MENTMIHLMFTACRGTLYVHHRGLAQWQTDAVDLPTELLNFLNSTDHTQQIPEIGLRSETGSLFLHILTSCKSKIIAEALRNLVANVRSPYKHIVFAGNVFSDGGDWSTADSRVSSATVARHLQLDVNAVTATEGDSAVKTKVVVASPTDSWTNAGTYLCLIFICLCP
uniref:Microtubule-associated protein 1B/S N-terminal domain-containing protein n=1 Tax=Plectus sambesii TaxID=2011161 RepID=A0A914W3A7_9BILA